jgi:hypothetical protein
MHFACTLGAPAAPLCVLLIQIREWHASWSHNLPVANPRDPYAELMERAANCERLAEKTADHALAKGFRDLAEQWRRSAELHKKEEALVDEQAGLIVQPIPKS